MNDTQMEQLLRQWWAESYLTPPGTHALMTHLGWGRYLLEHLEQEQQRREQPR